MPYSYVQPSGLTTQIKKLAMPHVVNFRTSYALIFPPAIWRASIRVISTPRLARILSKSNFLLAEERNVTNRSGPGPARRPVGRDCESLSALASGGVTSDEVRSLVLILEISDWTIVRSTAAAMAHIAVGELDGSCAGIPEKTRSSGSHCWAVAIARAEVTCTCRNSAERGLTWFDRNDARIDAGNTFIRFDGSTFEVDHIIADGCQVVTHRTEIIAVQSVCFSHCR